MDKQKIDFDRTAGQDLSPVKKDCTETDESMDSLATAALRAEIESANAKAADRNWDSILEQSKVNAQDNDMTLESQIEEKEGSTENIETSLQQPSTTEMSDDDGASECKEEEPEASVDNKENGNASQSLEAVDKSNEIEEDESSNEVTPIAARIRGRAKSTASSAPTQNTSQSSQLNPYNKIKNAPIFNTRKKGKNSKI